MMSHKRFKFLIWSMLLYVVYIKWFQHGNKLRELSIWLRMRDFMFTHAIVWRQGRQNRLPSFPRRLKIILDKQKYFKPARRAIKIIVAIKNKRNIDIYLSLST